MIPTRFALAFLCVLPAVAVESPARVGAPVVASFMYACASDEPRPTLTTERVGAGVFPARAASATVEVFELGRTPVRAGDVIGEVRVRANSGRTSDDELLAWAKRGARSLGGDAVVGWAVDDAAASGAGPVGLLCGTAKVVRWR